MLDVKSLQFIWCFLLLISFISATSWLQITATQQFWSSQWDIYWIFQSFGAISLSAKKMEYDLSSIISISSWSCYLLLPSSVDSSQESMESHVIKITCQEAKTLWLASKLFGLSLFSTSLEMTKCLRKVGSKRCMSTPNSWLLMTKRKNLTKMQWEKTSWRCTFFFKLLFFSLK